MPSEGKSPFLLIQAEAASRLGLIQALGAIDNSSTAVKTSTALVLVKLVHTAAWAFFAGCIILLPIAAFFGRFDLAAILIGLVTFEILVLAVNRWACPLTGVAARFTTDRSDNFDIFLPLLLARYNKQVFGSLFLFAVVYTAYRWWRHSGGT